MQKPELPELLDVSPSTIGGRGVVTVTFRVPIEMAERMLGDPSFDHPNLEHVLELSRAEQERLDDEAAHAAVKAAPATTIEPATKSE